MFTAYTIHPHVVVRRNGETAHEALQYMFSALVPYGHDDATRCARFWDAETVADDLALIGRVEGYCGAVAFECVPCGEGAAQ